MTLHAISRAVPASARTVKTDADFSTSSTSFVDVTGSSTSLTVAANSRILVCVTGVTSPASNAYACIDLNVDGSDQGGTFGLTANRDAGGGGLDQSFTLSYLTATLSSGSHTVKVRFRTTSGTSSIYASSSVTPLVISLIEIPT